jgi:hypothetical protein
MEFFFKEVGLELNADKSKYTFLSRHQNAEPNHRSFKNAVDFKYLGRAATNQNLNQEEIKRRLNYGCVC